MRKILKILGVGAGGLAALAGIFLAWAFTSTAAKLRKIYDIPPLELPKFRDQADLAHGKHLATVRLGCAGCHGPDLSGHVVVENPMVARIYGSNITPEALKEWTDEEVARAIRHGVKKDGRPILLMPSQDYQHLSAKDLREVVAYVRSVRAVDKPSKPSDLGPVMKILYALGKVPTLTPVLVVDHQAPFPAEVAESASPAFGEYMAKTTCMGCHGPQLSGGPIPGGDPKWPPASPITKDAMATWTEGSFIKALRTGVTPEGRTLRFPMVTKSTKNFTELELRSLWAYIQSLPSTDFGGVH